MPGRCPPRDRCSESLAQPLEGVVELFRLEELFGGAGERADDESGQLLPVDYLTRTTKFILLVGIEQYAATAGIPLNLLLQYLYARLIDYLNALNVDHIVMENAHRPLEELAVFKDLRPEIGLGLGVVDIKINQVESADDIARGIERAEAVLGAGRVTYINPDCGMWMLPRGVADRKIRALVEGRDLYEGR